MVDFHLAERVLDDQGMSFGVLVLEPIKPRLSVLFGVGYGGHPVIKIKMLQTLADRGCTVVAPRFDRLTSPVPSADALVIRARRMRIAFEEVARTDLPAVGVGHSIGAALLLILAGAAASTMARETVRVSFERRLEKLALLAPATDFFSVPGALQAVTSSIAVWAGTRDEITPIAAIGALKTALPSITPVAIRTITGAGHFSFMNTPPPHIAEPLLQRDAVLECLAEELSSFLVG